MWRRITPWRRLAKSDKGHNKRLSAVNEYKFWQGSSREDACSTCSQVGWRQLATPDMGHPNSQEDVCRIQITIRKCMTHVRRKGRHSIDTTRIATHEYLEGVKREHHVQSATIRQEEATALQFSTYPSSALSQENRFPSYHSRRRE